jgi:UDP-N-acetylmuramoyl-L-alanyl-D-glutamate--2,6-diaminopimelate ligase
MNKLLVKIKKYLPRKIFKVIQPAYHYLLSYLAAVVYRFPSEEMIIIGVTGTAGKTTTAYLVSKIISDAGFKVGFTSSALFHDGEKEWLNDTKMTMVGGFFNQKILRQMQKNGCQYAIVETTSEGIKQFRHRFINYDSLIFTGLFPEHIESHGSFENYKKAKGELFARLKKTKTKYIDEEKRVNCSASNMKKLELNRVKKTIIANLDDEQAEYFLDFLAEEKWGFASKQENINKLRKIFGDNLGVIGYRNVVANEKGIDVEIEDKKMHLNLLGDFNAGNAAAAYTLGRAQNFQAENIISALEKVSGVSGRMEKIDVGQDFTVIVDYAFENKGMEKLYKIIELLPHNKIIHVFGAAGGGRDTARRPIMGGIAGEKADYVILTNEDPFDDDPQKIIDEISSGARAKGKMLGDNLFEIQDRREAIKKAIDLANIGDMVLISGKGSEQAICMANDEKIPWDDREEAKKLLKDKIEYEKV